MREIVLDLLKKRQVSPCDQSPDCALNRETRPKSPADKKSSRPKRGVFFSGFSSREWLFRTLAKVNLKDSVQKAIRVRLVFFAGGSLLVAFSWLVRRFLLRPLAQ